MLRKKIDLLSLMLESEIPLTDAVLKLIHTCLHSRDEVISYQSTHQILRTIFGHFIERSASHFLQLAHRQLPSTRFLRNEIDVLLSPEKVLVYLSDIRTKVLWPDGESASTPIRNVKQRASNACMSKIPSTCRGALVRSFVFRLVIRLAAARRRRGQCSSNHHSFSGLFRLRRTEPVSVDMDANDGDSTFHVRLDT